MAIMKLARKAVLVFDRILNFLIWIDAALLIMMMVFVCADVVMRYFLHRPLIWVIEVVGYMLLGITFLGAAYVLREEGHTRVDLLLDYLNARARALANALTSILGIAVCMIVTWYSAQVTWQHYQAGYYLDTALDPPSFYFHAIVSVGCLLLFVQFMRRFSGYLRRWDELRSRDKEHMGRP